MELTIDHENNVAYLQLTDRPIERTLKLDKDTLIDVDFDNNIVGIEILDLRGIGPIRIPSQAPLGLFGFSEESNSKLWWGQLPVFSAHTHDRKSSTLQWDRNRPQSIAVLPQEGGEKKEVDVPTFAA